MGVKIFHSGDWSKTEKYLKRIGSGEIYRGLESLAKKGVLALQSATPVDTNISASSWGYTVKYDRNGAVITWTNSNIENGFPVVVMLQYGHATGTGGYVQGYDFINPAIRPIFKEIADEVWKRVKS